MLIVLTLCHEDALARQVAVMLVTIFVAYLRPASIHLVRNCDILEPSPSAVHYGLRLHPEEVGVPSKTYTFDDGVPLDAPYAIWLGPLLHELASRGAPNAPLFNTDGPTLKLEFARICEKLGIKDPCTYRLRHGGASHDHAAGLRKMLEIKLRGGWANDRSLKRYEKPIRLQHVETSLPQEWLQLARTWEKQLPALLRGSLRPPALPWL